MSKDSIKIFGGVFLLILTLMGTYALELIIKSEEIIFTSMQELIIVSSLLVTVIISGVMIISGLKIYKKEREKKK